MKTFWFSLSLDITDNILWMEYYIFILIWNYIFFILIILILLFIFILMLIILFSFTVIFVITLISLSYLPHFPGFHWERIVHPRRTELTVHDQTGTHFLSLFYPSFVRDGRSYLKKRRFHLSSTFLSLFFMTWQHYLFYILLVAKNRKSIIHLWIHFLVFDMEPPRKRCWVKDLRAVHSSFYFIFNI